ncbi:hypothetical protein CEUSTIGMA_g10486.t1 [Chlamydomonas eustigma]|uniref:DNA polymerase n=1 Tax=Chlamydomonas eustigma TaxID=1157962 RepID=A0A250XJT3_9CHLO|nr:hypothetical protein CEUSTIGMA_g10486.t1 [Chlamydomonas eustigma]|eukprot:GAX83060.1 hypothetical protein CEUSTIGMA_g10486.t1 [Chlamydomonas eustigma]
MERSRRQPVISTDKANVRSALEALRAFKEGNTKRASNFELKDEKALYDVVTEEDYADIAAKRRAEGGDFIIDDDGQGYQDIGEDDYWNERVEDGNIDLNDRPDESRPNKKGRTDEKGENAKMTSKKRGGSETAADGSGNIAKLFKTAAARNVQPAMNRGLMAQKPSHDSSEALLEDILKDMGGASCSALQHKAARSTSNQSVIKSSTLQAVPVCRPSTGNLTATAKFGVVPTPKAQTESSVHSVPNGCVAIKEEDAREASFQGFQPDVEEIMSSTPEVVKREEEEYAIPALKLEASEASPQKLIPIPDVLQSTESQPACGWAAMYNESAGSEEYKAEKAVNTKTEETEDLQGSVMHQEGLPLDAQGYLSFFYLDAYENIESRPGEVFLFGKVQADDPVSSHSKAAATCSQLVSCCVLVKGLQRSLIVVPRKDIFDDRDGEISQLEAEAAAEPSKKINLLKYLQERCKDVKAELRELLSRHGIKQHRMVPIKRNYAFEVDGVPHGLQYCIKVRYPASDPTLPLGLTGSTFVTIFGAQQSPLEALLIKRGLKGPSWLSVKGATKVEYSNQMSWCKLEVYVNSSKAVSAPEPGSELYMRPSPPLTVAAMQLKTIINPATHQHEIVAAGVVHLSSVNVEAPMSKDSWNRPAVLRNFTIVRKLDGQAWPPGFEQAVRAENATARGRANSGNMLTAQTSERSLLTCLLARMQALDADVLVGHNIGAGDLTTLMYRMQHHKVPLWSRIGRLKRQVYPKLTGGGHNFGGGASHGVMSAVAGRLLCDTYLIARELVREVDYTLKTLSSSLLGQQREDLSPPDVPRKFENTASLVELCRHAEGDAWLALGIMFNLSALPLTKQLTNLSGSLWSRTLAGQRAQRIEMLLLHEFHARKFILPDKLSQKDKERLAIKNEGIEDEEDMMQGAEEEDVDGTKAKGGSKGSKKSKGPQYAGGLVLEPKKGLYDKIVIMLDFNSLYPSIIQEYNICFTTVNRPPDGGPPSLPEAPPPGEGMAPLPTVIQSLVHKRRQVKSQMANTRDPTQKQQLNIRQQALKLTANSMYGCLGFGNSRFYARPLAELITLQGRTILQSTVDLVQSGTINGEVIYGDTDSVMVHTSTDEVRAARDLGARIKKEVNKRYKLLEIELDGIFKCMLLLKKKKYAAVKLEAGCDGQLTEVMEQKGLDIVRRDWCPLSKDVGNFALSQILSGRPKEEVVMDIHNHLRGVREQVASGAVPLGKFIITKQLTKRPEDYPDVKGQPHVMVAARRKAAGKRDGVGAGETVPYIICISRAEPCPTPTGTPAPAAPSAQASADTASVQQAGQQALGSKTVVMTPVPPTSPLPCSSPQQTRPVIAVGTKQPVAHGTSFAERAFHPEEIRESRGSLVVDIEYYLGQQVHPVVSRLCAPIEGTDAAHIADCLGLDPSRFRSGGSRNGAGITSYQGEDYGCGLSALDDDSNFVGLEPLKLQTADGSGSFPFLGISQAFTGRVSADSLTCPVDAVGDPSKQLTSAQLANQAVLRTREAISKYYDCVVVADDETAPLESRNVVLRVPSSETEARHNCCLHPDMSKQGVLMSRAVTEQKLYLQLTNIVRQLEPELAIKRALAQEKAANPRSSLSEIDIGRRVPRAMQLQFKEAANGVAAFRDVSAYHWVNLGRLFGAVS